MIRRSSVPFFAPEEPHAGNRRAGCRTLLDQRIPSLPGRICCGRAGPHGLAAFAARPADAGIVVGHRPGRRAGGSGIPGRQDSRVRFGVGWHPDLHPRACGCDPGCGCVRTARSAMDGGRGAHRRDAGRHCACHQSRHARPDQHVAGTVLELGGVVQRRRGGQRRFVDGVLPADCVSGGARAAAVGIGVAAAQAVARRAAAARCAARALAGATIAGHNAVAELGAACAQRRSRIRHARLPQAERPEQLG
ncbi:hypothetical protein COLO4_00773 [Corchorus olitorius]|uniref:Uncharacterized protein n=1 Tax=Corchorus olitorius TaxID=93759 RepID=A0A1R3L3K3_9ROSI|nr:hypothetical protein COLO4_00773 [Corchorus olitorius]